MPQFVVRKAQDAYVYYETIIEADTPEEAQGIAEDILYEGKWIATGDVSDFDDYEIDGVRLLGDGETIEEFVSICVTSQERDAVLAGLKLLQTVVRTGDIAPMVREIYTNDGAHPGIDADAIDTLCERMNV